ncbi:MAG: hypothetical protein E7578_05125 [Ruminococcaceae bacterium]|nr:hypothetical protein [Oscillospiraceae bacterium]
MGFGIFLIGYAITFGSAFFSTYLFLDIIGCLIMAASLIMLTGYQKTFRFSAAASGVLCLAYMASAALRMMGYGTPADGQEVLVGEQVLVWVSSYIIPLVSLTFHAFFLYAVSKLALEVELPDIVGRCKTYMTVLVGYFGIYFFFNVLHERIAEASVRVHNVLAAGLNLFHAVWLLMMMFMILSCLKWIAPAEDVAAEERGERANDGILARVGEKLDRIQERARTPREKKEEEKLRRDLERPIESISDRSADDAGDSK